MPDEPSDKPTDDADAELFDKPEDTSNEAEAQDPTEGASDEQPETAETPEDDIPVARPRKITPSSETKPDKSGKGKNRPEPTTFGGKLWHNWVKPIGTVVVIVIVLRSMLIDWNDVPTGSMEPEIQVGDRIAVNRLSYGLQFPLTGPTIGIPFTPLQWDNPLDGVPQINWSQPERGDIVTFWNPVTNVRMVKRIVAVPGDVVSMQGGVMTINGEAASYTDITSDPPRQTRYLAPGPMGSTSVVTKPLQDMTESLLGETRNIQHIEERWLDDVRFVELSDGERVVVRGGQISRMDQNRRPIAVPLNVYLQQMGLSERELARFDNGAIIIDGEQASYNDLTQTLLSVYSEGGAVEMLAGIDLAIDGHRLLLGGEAVSLDIFEDHFKRQAAQVSGPDAAVVTNGLQRSLEILGASLMTNFGPVELGEGEFYMVGDNRNNSHDSRRFGPVQRQEITGQAFAVAFSFKDNQMFALPPRPNWSRWFRDLD